LAGAYPTTQINLIATTGSVNDIDRFLNAVTLLPNPAKNFIQLKGVENINISNVLGREVFTSNVVDSKIDTSNLNSGVYFLTIQSESSSKSIKFVKQ
jgi:hypothetical protein